MTLVYQAGSVGRVSGLRRDEVAQLAQLSVDYYIELERGTAQPSSGIIAPLAAALRMSRDEREVLYNLAGRSLPALSPTIQLLPAMHDLLQRLNGTPAYVTTDLQVVLAQNSLAEELHGPLSNPGDITSSFVYRWFVDPEIRAQFPTEDHDIEANALIADLRSSVARRNPNDPDVTRLIVDLTSSSPWFARLWNRHDVVIRRREFKRLLHPQQGLIVYDCHALLSEDATQRLIWYDEADEQTSRLATVAKSLIVSTPSEVALPYHPHPSCLRTNRTHAIRLKNSVPFRKTKLLRSTSEILWT